MAFPLDITDQMGRRVQLQAPPQRIVSLCPSLTETLVHMGVGARLVGRTRFCIHPAPVMKGIAQVGGTKDVAMDHLRALQPDLVIGEKEENTPEMIAALAAEFPVCMTDVCDLAGAGEMLGLLGAVTGLEAEAGRIAAEVEASWSRLRRIGRPVECLYFIWKSPWMVAGADTFIDSVLEKCGFVNVARAWQGRYPMLDMGQFLPENPILVLLSTEPFPFKDSHVAEIQALMPRAVVRLVDGEMFSWYGSHMIGVENYMNPLLRDVEFALSLHD